LYPELTEYPFPVFIYVSPNIYDVHKFPIFDTVELENGLLWELPMGSRRENMAIRTYDAFPAGLARDEAKRARRRLKT
jgi:hypothetical protein